MGAFSLTGAHERIAQAAAELLDLPQAQLLSLALRAGGNVPTFVELLLQQGLVAPARAAELTDHVSSALTPIPEFAVPSSDQDTPPVAGGHGDAEGTVVGQASFDARGLQTVLPEQLGRYVDVEEFARGGMGRVLRGYDRSLQRVVAIKELLPFPRHESTARLSEHGMVDRFLQEAKLTAQMEHPGIVPVHELGQREDGTYYYTMKLVRGQTLREAVTATQDLAQRLALLPHFVALCQALAYAHSNGVVHRDIKPGNIILGEFGETVVIDWGLAKRRGERDVYAGQIERAPEAVRRADDEFHSRTTYGEAIGTPGFMAPEQARGELNLIDERSDVFALGAVLYYLLTGHPPYEGKTGLEALAMAEACKPRAPESLEPKAPPELCAICRRAMARDHRNRYQSAKELADEVSRFLSGALVESYRYRTSDYLTRFVRRNAPNLGAAGIAVVLLFVLGIFSVYRVVHERDAAEAARREAVVEKRRAQENAAQAQTASELAKQQGYEKEQERQRAERELYTARIGLAQAHIQRREFAAALALLEDAPAAHRHWEWGWLQALSNQDIATYDQRGVSGWYNRRTYDVDFGNDLVYLQRSVGQVNYAAEAPLRGALIGTAGLASGEDGGAASITVGRTGRFGAVLAGSVVHLLHESEQRHTVRDALGIPGSVAFSDDEARVAIHMNDLGLALFALVDAPATPPQLLRVIPGLAPSENIWMSAKGRYVAACDRGNQETFRLRIWQADSGALLYTADGLSAAVAAFAPDESALYLGLPGQEGLAQVRLPEGRVHVLTGAPVAARRALAVSPGGGLAASDDGADGVLLWDLRGAAPPRRVLRDEGEVSALAFHPGGTLLAIGGTGRVVHVYDLERDVVIQRYEGHTETIEYLRFDPARPLLASGSDAELKLWNYAHPQRPIHVGDEPVVAVAWRGPLEQMRMVTSGGDLVDRNAESGTEWRATLPPGPSGDRFLFSPSGAHAVRWNANTAEWLRFSEAGPAESLPLTHLDRVTDTAFAPDEARLAVLETQSDGHTLGIHLYAEGKMTQTLDVPGQFTVSESAASRVFWFDPESIGVLVGRSVLRLSVQEQVQATRFTLPAPIRTLPGAAFTTQALDDGRMFIAYELDSGDLSLVELGAASDPIYIPKPGAALTALALSNDGARLFSGDAGGRIKVWDAHSGRLIIPLPEQHGAVLGLWYRKPAPSAGCVPALVATVQEAPPVVFPAVPWQEGGLIGDEQVPMRQRIEAQKRLLAWSGNPLARENREELEAARAVWSGEKPRPESVALPTPHGYLLAAADTYVKAMEQGDGARAARVLDDIAARLTASNLVLDDLFRQWLILEQSHYEAALALYERVLVPRGLQIPVETVLPLARAACALGRYDSALAVALQLPWIRANSNSFAITARILSQRDRPGDAEMALQLLVRALQIGELNEDVQAAWERLAPHPRLRALPEHAEVALLLDPSDWPAPPPPDADRVEDAIPLAARERKALLVEMYDAAVAQGDPVSEAVAHPYVQEVLAKRALRVRLERQQTDAATWARWCSKYGVRELPALVVLDSAENVLWQVAGSEAGRELRFAWAPQWDESAVIRDWYVLGPFAPGTAANGLPCALDGPPDVEAQYPGRDGMVQWHRVRGVCPDGTSYVAAHFDTETPGEYLFYARMAYAGTVPGAQHTYVTGAPIWVNGKMYPLDRDDGTALDFQPGDNHLYTVANTIRQNAAASFWLASPRPLERPLATAVELPELRDLPTRPGLDRTRVERTPRAAPGQMEEELAGILRDMGPVDAELRVDVHYQDIRPYTRAPELMKMYPMLNMTPYLNEQGELIGITSDHFAEHPALAAIGLRNGDVILQFEDLPMSEVFRLGPGGRLDLNFAILQKGDTKYDRLPVYTSLILRDGKRCRVAAVMNYEH